MPTVTAEAPAKVNLWLGVGPPGDDGYHPLATVFQALDLVDRVRASTSEPGGGVTLSVAGEGADLVPTDSGNLAWRAAELIAAEAGVGPDVRLELDKRIPVAGGMAGGSADAAATLVACDALWRVGLSRERMMALAADLGSDVPFALHGGTAVGTGRGTELTTAMVRGSFHWVFALAFEGLSTPSVYRECDRLREGADVPEPEVPAELMAALSSGDAKALGRTLTNDLQPAALSLRPQLRQVLEIGEEYGALGGIVSGSGPTCAFLARDDEHAIDLAVAFTASGVCRTVKRAAGPVHGARVVDQRAV